MPVATNIAPASSRGASHLHASACGVDTPRGLTATRLVEKTRDAFREVSDLAQTRIGRARTIVSDTYSLYAKHTTFVSTEEPSIDGKKVLLG